VSNYIIKTEDLFLPCKASALFQQVARKYYSSGEVRAGCIATDWLAADWLARLKGEDGY
jgi:hypothetical protein